MEQSGGWLSESLLWGLFLLRRHRNRVLRKGAGKERTPGTGGAATALGVKEDAGGCSGDPDPSRDLSGYLSSCIRLDLGGHTQIIADPCLPAQSTGTRQFA